MNKRELESKLHDLFDGRLDRATLGALEDELRSNPEARETYGDYAILHNSLQLRADGVDLMRIVPMDEVIGRQQRRMIRKAGLAAVAVLVLGAFVMTLVLVHNDKPPVTFMTSPGAHVSVSHRQTEDEEPPTGMVMTTGSRLEVRIGTVELEFASGVRAVVRGPAAMTLQRDDLLQLENGRAWFEVPPKATGFQVETPDLLLTDLGTEFGIVSDPRLLDEVHVFTGKVEIFNRHGLEKKVLLIGGEARIGDPTGRWRKIPVRRDHFVDELPATAPEEFEVISETVFDIDEFAFASDVSSDDLLHGLQPAVTGWNFDNDATVLELTDGIHGAEFSVVPGNKVQGAWTTVGATAEYYLGTGTNGSGYDITSIQSIAAWVNVGFGNQAWMVEVKPVGGTYRILERISYCPLDVQIDGGGATKVTLSGKSGVLAKGIESIRFTAERIPGSVKEAFVWRELDVFGKPTDGH